MKSFYYAILCLMISSSLYAAEFAVSPMLIELTGAPNSKQDFEFSVHGKTSGNVKLSLFDLAQQESGHMDFIAIEEKQGLPEWITLERERFSVKQGETETIKGSISTPRNVSGSHLAAIMVEEEKQDDDKGGVAVTVRYAIVLTLDLGGKRKARTKTAFDDLKIQIVKDELVVSALFTNHGTQDNHLKSEVQIRDSNRKLLDRVTLKTQSAWQRGDSESRVFPGATVKVYGVISKPIRTNLINATVRNKFGGKLQPTMKAELNAPQLFDHMKRAVAENRLKNMIQPVKMKKRGKQNAFGKVMLNNPTRELITIQFPEETEGHQYGFRFSPKVIQIQPGQRKFALLTHDWDDDIASKKINYKATLVSKNGQDTLLIPTTF